MIKLPIDPYIVNAMDYFMKHIGVDDSDWQDEYDTDRQFMNWLTPIYKCRIKVRKKDGRGRWVEFDHQSDATLFALRWA